MEIFTILFVLVVSYLIGSIPPGLLIVRFTTGQDVRQVASGRTGGTNVMRAAGFFAGFATAMLDILKGYLVARLAIWIAPQSYWLHVAAPLLGVLGHNYSIYLLERKEDGRLHWRGGAGATPCAGGAMGLWAPSILIILPLSILVLYFIGYASLATTTTGLLTLVIFIVRYSQGAAPWEYVLYGIGSVILLGLALVPNFKRLAAGSERLVGYRARKKG